MWISVMAFPSMGRMIATWRVKQDDQMHASADYRGVEGCSETSSPSELLYALADWCYARATELAYDSELDSRP